MKARRDLTCAICGYDIKKGDYKLGANLGSGYYPKHYHLLRFADKYGREMMKVLVAKVSYKVLGSFGYENHEAYFNFIDEVLGGEEGV